MVNHALVTWFVMFPAMKILAPLTARSVIGKTRLIAQSPVVVVQTSRSGTGLSGLTMVVLVAQVERAPG
jgi:hypothetical protein